MTFLSQRYLQLRGELTETPRTWLITGVAGFIGSNLLEELLNLGQTVVGLDNFSTGHQTNLDSALASQSKPGQFRFVEGDVRDLGVVRAVSNGVDYVLHQAALGSVPRSLHDPLTSAQVNVDGTLHVLIAARDAGVKRVVYASSSSVYGDAIELPQVEERTGRVLSPYAATKAANEMFADVFQRTYGMEIIGLRYFNVFGPRQDPNGAYAAVIPRWVQNLLTDHPCPIFGDGETSRDFCHVANVIQANLLAAVSADAKATGQPYNIACGESTSLNTLFCLLRDGLAVYRPSIKAAEPRYEPFRPGDVRRSLANIAKARANLGYEPQYQIKEGLAETLPWYADSAGLRSDP
jgi:UDP-N-acetylglucosamine/UDP-N-acetylgalactosamine 4-epimerase